MVLVERPDFFWVVLQLADGFPVNKNKQRTYGLINKIGDADRELSRSMLK